MAVHSVQVVMIVGEQTLRSHVLRLSLTLIAAVVALMSLDGGTAAASCGDYVMVGGEQHDSQDSMPAGPTCKGPHCQNQMPLPAVPSKALLTFQPSDAAYWRQNKGSSNPPSAHAAYSQCPALPEGHPLALLRPPCV